MAQPGSKVGRLLPRVRRRVARWAAPELDRELQKTKRKLRTTRYSRLAAGWGLAAALIVLGAFVLPFVESSPLYHRTKIGEGGFAASGAG